ncbi:unnamed protein product [Urochloa humidicola]
MAKQSGSSGAAAAVGGVGRGVEATEEQARAVISMAKRAVEEAAKIRGDGAAAAGKPSLKRSLECFLDGRRKNKARTPPREELIEKNSSTTSSSPSPSPSN